MTSLSIEKIELPVNGIDDLQAVAREEGYQFVGRLVEEWNSGAIRFDHPGEVLCGCIDDGVLVAVGGLNRDMLR